MVSSLDNMDMLVNRMNAAMPQVVRTVDQVEALATSLNAAMPQVTLSEEGRTLLAKVVGGTPCAFAAMPRVGPTLEYAEGMGQIARDEQTHEETS